MSINMEKDKLNTPFLSGELDHSGSETLYGQKEKPNSSIQSYSINEEQDIGKKH